MLEGQSQPRWYQLECPPCPSPIWISGFICLGGEGTLSKKLVIGAGGQAGAGTRRLLRAHPALPCPESAVPCGHCMDSTKASKGWGLCTGMWGPAPLWPPPAPPGNLGLDRTSPDAPPVLDSPPPGLAPLPAPLRSEETSVRQTHRGRAAVPFRTLSELSQGQTWDRHGELLSWGLTIFRNPVLFLRMKSS